MGEQHFVDFYIIPTVHLHTISTLNDILTW